MTIKKLQNGSDIRGVALDTNPHEAVNLGENETIAIGFSHVKLLSEKLNKEAKSLKIAVGRDSRLSGESLLNSLSKALSSAGATVLDCGLASTPAMFMSTKFDSIKADAGIMITASHLPTNRNGFKFFTEEGGANKNDISTILNYAEEYMDNIEDLKTDLSISNANIQTTNLMELYSNHLKAFIKDSLNKGELPLKGMKIVVDAGNGSGGFYAESVLKPLGANIDGSLYLDPDGNFPNHIPNPEDKDAMKAISSAVIENSADIGIIFDTDVDRSSAVDNTGNEISRNKIVALAAALVADDYPETTIVTDSITSDFLTEFIENDLKLKHLRYKRGYKNVIDKAIELNKEGQDCQLAIETSGHAAMKENFFLDDGAYLATKIVIKAAQLKDQGSSISTLISSLKEAEEIAEIRLPIVHSDFSAYGDNIIAWLKAWVNAEDCIGSPVDPDDVASVCSKCHCGTSLVEPNFEGIRIKFDKDNGDGWALVRKSLHDPIMPVNIESNIKGGADQIRMKLRNFLKQFNGIDTSKL